MPEEPGSRCDHQGEVVTESFSITDALEGLNESLESQIGRARALLTETDRRYLLGDESYDNAQSERNRRYELRQRVIEGFKDAPFLFRLRNQDRKQIAKEVGRDTLVRAGAFLYNGIRNIGADPIEYWENVLNEVHDEEVNIVYIEEGQEENYWDD